MADDASNPSAPHPFVKALRRKTDGPTVALTGLMDEPPKKGRWRIYLSPQLDSYAEFSDDDVVHWDTVPADAVGLRHDAPATRVTLKRGARIDVTRTASVQADNQWDLDVQIGRGQPSGTRALAGAAAWLDLLGPDRTMNTRLCATTLLC